MDKRCKFTDADLWSLAADIEWDAERDTKPKPKRRSDSDQSELRPIFDQLTRNQHLLEKACQKAIKYNTHGKEATAYVAKAWAELAVRYHIQGLDPLLVEVVNDYNKPGESLFIVPNDGKGDIARAWVTKSYDSVEEGRNDWWEGVVPTQSIFEIARMRPKRVIASTPIRNEPTIDIRIARVFSKRDKVK